MPSRVSSAQGDSLLHRSKSSLQEFAAAAAANDADHRPLSDCKKLCVGGFAGCSRNLTSPNITPDRLRAHSENEKGRRGLPTSAKPLD